MGQISLLINGRTFDVACDDGEEEHLMELAEYVVGQAEGIAGSIGQMADSRLLLMTSLTVADELGEALARVDELERDLDVLKSAKRPLMTGQPSDPAAVQEDAQQLVDILDRATARVTDIAARVANA